MADEQENLTDEQPESNPADHLKPHQWKPGQSGNPKGRPKNKTLTDSLSEALEEEIEESGQTKEQVIAKALANLLIRKLSKRKFDSALFNAIFDRRDPRPHTVEVYHKDDDVPKIIVMPVDGPPDDMAGEGADDENP